MLNYLVRIEVTPSSRCHTILITKLEDTVILLVTRSLILDFLTVSSMSKSVTWWFTGEIHHLSWRMQV